MSGVFFDAVVEELGHKLRYEAISNYAGNSFCSSSWEMINDAFPFNMTFDKHGGGKKAMTGLAKMVSGGKVKVMQKGGHLPGSLGKMPKGKKK